MGNFLRLTLHRIRKFEDDTGDGEDDINQVSVLVAFKVDATPGRLHWVRSKLRRDAAVARLCRQLLAIRLLHFGVLDFGSVCSAYPASGCDWRMCRWKLGCGAIWGEDGAGIR